MRQQLDIKDVEEKTKIRAKYLRAMENEDFGLLPGPTFIKSFLRTYAAVLGLDPQLLVEDFRARYEEVAEVEYQPITPPDPRSRDRSPRRGPGAGGAVVLALLALLGFLLVLGITGEGDSGEGETGAITAPEPAPDKAPRRRPRPVPAVAPKAVVLTVRPTEGTYVCVDDGRGKRVFEGTVTQQRRFRARRRLRINLGRRSAALTVNGRRVRIPKGSEAIGFDATTRSVKRLGENDLPCA